MSEHLQTRTLYYRSLYPSWGSKMIKNELIVKDSYQAMDLPSLRTFGRFLKSKNLTIKYDKNLPLPNEKLPKISQCHQCWQMDDKGPEPYKGVGHVGMINIKSDRRSGCAE